MGWFGSPEWGVNPVLLEIGIGMIGLTFPLWLIWRAYRTSNDLDHRLSSGDVTLLTDDRYTVDRVTLGPPGTTLVDDVQFVMVSSGVSNRGGEGE